MFRLLVVSGADVDNVSLADECPLSLSLLQEDLQSVWELLHLGARAGNGQCRRFKSSIPLTEEDVWEDEDEDGEDGEEVRRKLPLPDAVVRKMKDRILKLGNLGLLYAASHYAGLELDAISEESLRRTVGRVWKDGFKVRRQPSIRQMVSYTRKELQSREWIRAEGRPPSVSEIRMYLVPSSKSMLRKSDPIYPFSSIELW
jgi:hypothetical protein